MCNGRHLIFLQRTTHITRKGRSGTSDPVFLYIMALTKLGLFTKCNTGKWFPLKFRLQFDFCNKSYCEFLCIFPGLCYVIWCLRSVQYDVVTELLIFFFRFSVIECGICSIQFYHCNSTTCKSKLNFFSNSTVFLNNIIPFTMIRPSLDPWKMRTVSSPICMADMIGECKVLWREEIGTRQRIFS